MEMNYPPYTITDKMLNLATSIIRKHQEEYYTAIQNCNNEGNSNEFIEFMLKVINEAVDGMIVTSNQETTQEK